MKLLNGAKSFAMNLGIGFAIEVVRGWFNEQLKDTSPSDLYEAVIHDADLWTSTPTSVKQAGLKYKGTFGSLLTKYQHNIDTELILSWIKEDHPALYSTLINIPEEYGEMAGIVWLDKQVNRIKQMILS